MAYWLCPAEPARSQLAAVITDLAARFDAPIFEPHVTVFVANAGHDDPAEVMEELLTDCGTFQLAVSAIDYCEKFTKTLFVQFLPDSRLTGLTEDFRRASRSPGDYQLNPHLSLIYKEMDADAKRQLAASITLPLGQVTFDTVRAIISPAEIKSRYEVDAWRVVAERRLMK